MTGQLVQLNQLPIVVNRDGELPGAGLHALGGLRTSARAGRPVPTARRHDLTQIVETEAGAPPVLIVTKSELGNRSGGILRALATGAAVRVDDLAVGCAATIMVPPSWIPEVLRLLGIDPGTLPEPGTARDHLVGGD